LALKEQLSKMTKKIDKYISVSDLTSFKSPNRLDNSFIISDKVHILPAKNIPFRTNMVALAVVEEGYIEINLDLDHYKITPSQMLIVYPEQIFNYVNKDKNTKYFFFIFDQKYFEDIFINIQNIINMFLIIKENPVIDLNPLEIEKIKDFYFFIKKHIKEEKSEFTIPMLQNLIKSLFYQICQIVSQKDLISTSPKTRKEEVFERFIRLLREQYKQEHKVSFYANELCITSKYLSSVIKQVSGYTVSKWINDYVILEAKALLKSSDRTILEISEDLNFSNQSFFSKYFKQHTGISPKQYRNTK